MEIFIYSIGSSFLPAIAKSSRFTRLIFSSVFWKCTNRLACLKKKTNKKKNNKKQRHLLYATAHPVALDALDMVSPSTSKNKPVAKILVLQ